MTFRFAIGATLFVVSCSALDASPPPVAVSSAQQALREGNEPADCDAPGDEKLEVYAAKCRDAMDGIEVPPFDCDDKVLSTEVPDTNGDGLPYGFETCDRPNVLNGACDPRSRFQLIINKGDIRAVAHCRKKGDSDGVFNDIAVIAYNQRTGDTCFFQSVIDQHISGAMPSPIGGQQGVWKSPAETVGDSCIGCHDNGPFIRSPYLNQLKDVPDAIAKGAIVPGSGSYSWNKTQPYRFVGANFQGWKTYHLEVTNTGFAGNTMNECVTCHRMGMSSNGATMGHPNYLTSLGSTFLFGGIATAKTQAHKNAHSQASPIWMLPDDLAPNASVYSSTSEAEAALVKDCGTSVANGKLIDGCNFVRYGQGNTCRGAPVIGTINGTTQSTPTTTKHETIVPTGTGPGNPGFCYWKSVHGPFFQTSPAGLKFSDPNYFGSFLRIEVDSNNIFVAHSAVSPNPGTQKAEPGGKFECTNFAEIDGVTDIDQCFDAFNRIEDPKGSTPLTKLAVANSTTDGSALTGFVGSLSQFNLDLNDRVRLDESATTTTLMQQHYTSSMNGLKPGPSAAESWSFGCKQWSPKWLARHVFADTDSLLISAAIAPKARCFITGITGAWSSTRNNEATQPFAEIYTAPNGDVRLRVAPTSAGLPADRVGAFASCVQIKL